VLSSNVAAVAVAVAVAALGVAAVERQL